MRVFTIANRKGGTAKTTTVVNLAYGLTEYNKRVLVIDLDNQGHVMLGLKALASNDDVNDLSLPNHSLFSRVVKCSPMLYVASVDVDNSLSNEPVMLDSLRLWCDSPELVKHFDIVIIDTPPTLGPQLMAALSAATDIVIPAVPLPLASDGVRKLLNACCNAMEKRKFRATQLKILPVMVEQRLKLHRQELSSWYQRYGRTKVLTPIRKSINLAEAFGANMPVVSFAPRSRGAQDYTELCKQIIG